jgi:hypothetical protein
MSLFKRKSVEPGPFTPATGLPGDVIERIKAASFVDRRTGPNEPPRILVMMPGAAWYANEEDSPKALGRLFPELDDQQLERACAMLDARARIAIAENLRAEIASLRGNRQSWRDQYRPDDYLVTGGRR